MPSIMWMGRWFPRSDLPKPDLIERPGRSTSGMLRIEVPPDDLRLPCGREASVLRDQRVPDLR